MKFKTIVTAGAVAAMLVGCSNGNSATTDIKAPKFGFIGPLSGEASQYGTAVKNAMKMAISDYNKKHGTKITGVYYDDKADPTTAVNDYNKLYNDDKVTAVLSPVTTGSALSVASAASKNNTPILSPSASGDKFTMNGKTAYKNVFRICTNDSYAGTYLAKQSKTKYSFKNVAVLYNKESDYSTGVAAAYKAEAKKQGVNVSFYEAYNANTKDFSTFISKIKQANPDAVFLPDYYESVVSITKQLRDSGVKAPIFGADGWDGVLGVKGVNTADFENCFFTSGYNKDATSGPTYEFVKEYEKEYGTTPSMFAGMAYDTVTVMMKAINKAKSTDPEKVNAALAKVKVSDDEAVCGGFTYDKNHNPVKELNIVTVKNGQYVTAK